MTYRTMSDPLVEHLDDECQVPSDPSDPSIQLVDLEEDEESSEVAPESVAQEAEADNIEYYTVSGTNPRFDIIVSHSHINRPYYLSFPAKIASKLPHEKVPVVLKSKGKSWSMFYNGHNSAKVLELTCWRKFTDDNELKIGDCCVFELMEVSRKMIVFKVVILKTDPSFWGVADGDTAERPITL